MKLLTLKKNRFLHEQFDIREENASSLKTDHFRDLVLYHVA